jgi:hypothetical protein
MHFISLWDDVSETRLALRDFTPTPGVYQDIVFDTPVSVVAGTQYLATVYTQHYVFRSAGSPTVTSPSANLTADQGRLRSDNTPPGGHPDVSFNAWYYVSPLVDVIEDFVPVSSSLTAKWRVFQNVSSSLTGKWRVRQAVSTSLTAKWNVLAGEIIAPVVSSRYLQWQRKMTAAFIKDDPTTAELIPQVRVKTPSGGYAYSDGPARVAQTFKLSLLAYDQRPTLTVAGVERLMDFHLIGLHDMAIAVGDYWVDEAGTRYEVAGFTEGWDYETKAFVFRHVPRESRP